jgi:predicted amidohydrolase YtcJ
MASRGGVISNRYGVVSRLAGLSADPLTVPGDDLAATRALTTMVGGKIVYDTPNWAG